MARPKKIETLEGEKIQTTIYITRKTKAWLAYQAAMEGRSANDVVEFLLRYYHKKCTEKDPKTPAID